MAELINHVGISLNNFIADEGMLDGNIDSFSFLFDGNHVPDFLSDIQQYDLVLMGRKTYEF